MKKLLLLFLVLATVFTLAACNEKENDTTDTGEKDTESKEEMTSGEDLDESGEFDPNPNPDTNGGITEMHATVTNRVITLNNTLVETRTFQNADADGNFTGGSFEQQMTFSYNGWPTVISTEDGTLYAVGSVDRLWHVCPFGRNILFKSTDGGLTWQESTVINDGQNEGTYKDYRDAGLTYLGNGKMVMTYFYPSSDALVNNATYNEWMHEAYAAYGVTDAVRNSIKASLKANPYSGGSYMKYSNDYGATWSTEIKTGISSPHGVTPYTDGRLLYIGGNGDTIYKQFYTPTYDKDGNITGIAVGEAAPIFTLETLGLGTMAKGFRVCEPHAIVLASGRILVTTRTHNPDQGGKYMLLVMSYSDNGGATWTHKSAVDKKGETFEGAPGHLLQLDNGAVIMSYSARAANSGEYARISYDGGETWSDAIALNLEQSWSGDLGYPATALVKKEGETYYLTTVYYQRPDPGKPETELQCTTWTLK